MTVILATAFHEFSPFAPEEIVFLSDERLPGEIFILESTDIVLLLPALEPFPKLLAFLEVAVLIVEVPDSEGIEFVPVLLRSSALELGIGLRDLDVTSLAISRDEGGVSPWPLGGVDGVITSSALLTVVRA